MHPGPILLLPQYAIFQSNTLTHSGSPLNVSHFSRQTEFAVYRHMICKYTWGRVVIIQILK